MVQITFKNDSSKNLDFTMNPDIFEHRECRFCDDALLFDGYSIWFEGKGEFIRSTKNFSISIFYAPEGYSLQGDGLFSCFNKDTREGFYIKQKNHGAIEVGFGNGRETYLFSSLDKRVIKRAWNIITVIFHSEAGWCDLYVNGELVNRKQFQRHMQIDWPKQEMYIGRMDDLHEGIYYGLLQEVRIEDTCLSDKEVKAVHASFPVGKNTENTQLDRFIFKNDVQRPDYHLIAPGKWMNEPHDPLYYEGYAIGA
jgi:hypothetical protein